jgi:hypothetical protein
MVRRVQAARLGSVDSRLPMMRHNDVQQQRNDGERKHEGFNDKHGTELRFRGPHG